MTELGNWVNFIATIDRNPKRMDCKSNQSLVDTKLLLLSKLSSLQLVMNL